MLSLGFIRRYRQNEALETEKLRRKSTELENEALKTHIEAPKTRK